MTQFLDDFADGFRSRLDGEGAGRAAQAAVPLPFAVGEIERNHGDLLSLDVFPDVQLRPVQQRVDANVRAFFEIGLELVPQLRRLVAEIPIRCLSLRLCVFARD